MQYLLCLGILTNLIAQKAKKVTCIELDQRLTTQLEEIARQHKNTELVFGNVLNCYIPKCDKIITSLPYRIIEPFINKLLKCEFNELYMIVGNKYVDGILKKQNNKLSILTNCFFQTTKYLEIFPSSFNLNQE
ncbi:MAG: rRNA adenine N-6-methyltransferase family protein [Bacilli bacterium]